MSRTTGWFARAAAATLSLGLSFVVLAAPADEKAYRAGVGLANKGANDAAVQELNRYLSADPEGANAMSARYTLGVCLARLGKYQDAAKALDVVVGAKEFVFLNDARLLRAQCAAATGDYAGASAVLKKLLKESPPTPQFEKADQAAMLLGESQYRLGRAEQARTVLKNFAARWPKSESLDRAELICALAEISLSETESATTRLEALLKRSPDGACAGSGALALGQCRQSRGDLAGARAMYEVAAKSGDPAVVFDAGLGAARLARASGDLAGAENALRGLASAKGSPEQAAQVSVERGKLLMQQGKAEEAGALFAEVVRSGPESVKPAARLWLAKCDLKNGRAAQAAKQLQDLAEETGKSELLPEIVFDRAVALAQSGDDAGAVVVWADWQKRFANHALAAQAGASQAACLYRLGQYEKSLEVCRGVVERHREYPRMSEVVLLMGEDQFFLDRFAEASETYGEFIERYPNDPARVRIEIRRGLCFERLGRREDAEQALTKAIQNAGSDVDASLRIGAYSALGDLCVGKQDWPGAEKWFARAIEASGTNVTADLLLRAGVASARQGNAGAALPTLEKAWKAAGGTALENHAAFEYASALVKSGRTDEASERLTAIVQAEKQAGTPVLTSAALRQLAAIASTKGDAKGAAEALARIDSNANTTEGGSALLEQASAWLSAGEYAKAEQACNTYLETRAKGKGATVAKARRAIAMNRLGKHEDAAREFTTIATRSASLDAETLGAVKYETALALRSLGRDEEAAAAYRQVLEGTPSASVEAYACLDLAQIALGAKKTDEAMVLVERCRGAAGKLSAAEAAKISERETYVRALCLSASGKPAEAAKALEEFERTYPTSELLPSVRLTLGDALGQAGRARDAAAVLGRVANDPAVGANRGYALLKLGEVSANASLWDESEKAYSAFLESESANAMWFQARFGQGWARENQGKYDGACEAYRDVVERHEGPTAARAQFQIGECLYAQKKLDEAIRELLKVDVLYGYPEWSAAALYEAGRCMRELGREKEAAAQFEEVIKRFPETRWAALAKEVPATISAGAGGNSKSEASAER